MFRRSPEILRLQMNSLAGHQASMLSVLASTLPGLMATFTASSIAPVFVGLKSKTVKPNF
jgi:hypothetical protein